PTAGPQPTMLNRRCERYATSATVALAPDLNEDRLGKRSAHQKNREGRMRRLLCGFAGWALALLLGAAAAEAQDTAKIGLIMSYSGQFADTATQMDNGVKLYMKQNGDRAGKVKIELIRKDNGGIAPDVAKRLAQEVIVRDHADLLGGF